MLWFLLFKASFEELIGPMCIIIRFSGHMFFSLSSGCSSCVTALSISNLLTEILIWQK